MTRAASVLFHVSPSSCDTCRHRVWTRSFSVYFHVPLCYCAMCHFPVCQSVIFSFRHLCLSGRDTWRRCGKFLFGLVLPRGFDRSHIPIGPCVLSTCRVRFIRVRFLLDHESISHSRECPFRTAMCLKPLHVDVHTDPFHHRTNEMALLFQEISVIILTKQTTIKKVTTK